MKQALLFLIGALLVSGAVRAQQGPCCSITSIDARASNVTARINSTGQTFDFHVPDARLLSSLRVGQAIFANFKTHQVSLDGHAVCCSILSVGITTTPPSPSKTQNAEDRSGPRVPLTTACRHSWLPQFGGVICKTADPQRPAILFFHGLHQSAASWTQPSSTGYNYDYRRVPPEEDLGKHAAPNAGVYKVGLSEKLNVDGANWFDFLAGHGFTVAAFTQPCCNFARAYPAALAAFDQFLKDTAAANPSNPPPIALLGHSRGGLVIRKLLQDRGNAGGRIRWVITLHSPHHGSQVAKTSQVLAEQTVELFNGVELAPNVRDPLKQLTLQAVSPLNQLIDDGSRELVPESSLVQGLLDGERPLEGVRYYTFGGTTPTLFRLYVWLFTAMSSVPQYKGLEQYFDWQVKPNELGPVSPMLDRVRAIVPEIKAGEGDSLVTDTSARLPFATHQSDRLNHAEVLWDRSLQEKVAGILGASPSQVSIPRK